MKTLREYLRKAAFIVGAVAVILAAGALWDYNENRYDEKILSQAIYESLRIYNETSDSYAIMYPYIGSTRTKVFHAFKSDCARQISSTDLKGFDSIEEAAKARYAQCKFCIYEKNGN